MPLPVPDKKEKQQSFVERCVADSVMNEEHPDNTQRLAVCYSLWDKAKKKEKKDMGLTPEERQKGIKPSLEMRRLSLEESELRVDEGASGLTITGYAAVFNKWSEDLGGYREMVKPGAFKKTLKEADIRACINHDPNKVIGRNTAGTLTLSENNLGLKYEVPLQKQSYALDLVENIKAGNISGNSFAFRTITDRWGTDNEEDVRELIEVKLFDVGPVTYPAYPQTSLNVRSLFEQHGVDMYALDGLAMRIGNGITPKDKDLELLNAALTALRSLIPETGPQEHPGGGGNEPGDAHLSEAALADLEIRKRRLDLKLRGLA